MTDRKLLTALTSELWVAREIHENAEKDRKMPKERRARILGKYDGLVLAVARAADIPQGPIYDVPDYEALWRMIDGAAPGYWDKHDEEL